MEKKVVRTDMAPEPIGPYEQAVCVGPFLFASGQVGIKPGEKGAISGDIESQAAQVFENLKAVLEAAGSSLDCAVKVTLYLTNIGKFKAVNSVYERYFGRARPARSTVEVSSLPAGAAIEADVIAYLPDPGNRQGHGGS